MRTAGLRTAFEGVVRPGGRGLLSVMWAVLIGTARFKKSLWAVSHALLACSLLSGCEIFAGRTGGGTETETAGVLQHADGSPAISARVLVRPADYVADSLLTSEEVKPTMETFTDAKGRFKMKGLVPGAYRLEAQTGNGRGVVMDFALEAGERKSLPQGTLRPNGSILGRFADTSATLARFVQFYGLERLDKADPATGVFMLNGLAPGKYDLRFLGIEPFRKQFILRGVEVVSGEVLTLEPIVLEEIAKLNFSADSGILAIEGVGPSNPLIFDNEFWDGGVENEYIWSKAGAGLLELKGNIVTDAFRKNQITIDAQMTRARLELGTAGLAGLANIPEPVLGSRRTLLADASGRIEDVEAETSAGSQLIVAEAKKATPEKPLIVVAGGPLTTVANAYLSDPSIAANMVVLSIYPFTINSSDSLAAYVVAKRCRLVVWGRDYAWSGPLDSSLLASLPGSRMGEKVRAQVLNSARNGTASFGDIAPVAWLFSRKVWTGATLSRVQPPLAVQPASGLSFDFLDIPKAANDWHAYQEEFFASLAAAAAYAPKALPGRVEAEGYAARSGARGALTATGSAPDTSLGDAMAGAAGAWLDFQAASDAQGAVKVAVRARAPAGGKLTLTPSTGPALVIDLPASPDWVETGADWTVEEGAQTLRASWTEGAFDIDWIEVR